jgi:hypothetical protein
MCFIHLSFISKRHLKFNEDEEISFLFIAHSRLLPLFTCTTREPVDLKLFTDYWTVRGDFRPVNKIPVQYQAVLMFRLCSSLALADSIANICRSLLQEWHNVSSGIFFYKSPKILIWQTFWCVTNLPSNTSSLQQLILQILHNLHAWNSIVQHFLTDWWKIKYRSGWQRELYFLFQRPNKLKD